MAAPAKTPTAIQLPPLALETVEIQLIGTSPLICHAWSEKALRQMRDKQTMRAATARAAKNPLQEFSDSLYWLTDKPDEPTAEDIAAARFGFPAIAFKAALITACTSTGKAVKMTEARQAFHVVGEMVEIVGPPPVMREDVTRLQGTSADIRYRGQFDPWGVRVRVDVNKAMISPEQVANLFTLAGFGVGVGEWRPQRNGPHGRFRVAHAHELDALS